MLGETVHAADREELQSTILTPLFDAYAIENRIEVEDNEIEAWMDILEEAEDSDSTAAADKEELTDEEADEVDVVLGRAAADLSDETALFWMNRSKSDLIA